MSSFTDLLAGLEPADTVSVSVLRQILSQMDERANPYPKDGYAITETWGNSRDGLLGWFRSASGSVNDYCAGGFVTLQSGTTAGSYIQKMYGSYKLGDDKVRVVFNVILPTQEVGEDFVLTLGLAAQANSDLRVNSDAVNLVMDTANFGANWAVTTNRGSAEYIQITDTGIVGDTNLRQFAVEFNAAGDEIHLQTKLISETHWTMIDTLTADLPLNHMGVRISMAKPVGTTNKNFYIGHVGIRNVRV